LLESGVPSVKLFQAGKIGGLELKNRIIMSAMGVYSMIDADGNWTDRMREFYVARARGGVAMITTGLTYASEKMEASSKKRLNLHLDGHLESVRKTVAEVHSYGAKFCVQLTAGFGSVIKFRAHNRGMVPVSASANPCFFNPEILTRPLTTEEVEEQTRSFGIAAQRCQMAGVDAIELHSHKGYLMDQFMSAIWNRRNDKYGGSAEARLQFARETVAAIRSQSGPGLPIIYRIGLDHHIEGGRTVTDSLPILKALESMGIDALHVDAGCYEASWWSNPPTYQPPGCVVDMARIAKETVQIPVIAVGKLAGRGMAEQVLNSNAADFVAIGRGLLADPDWPLKVREGSWDDIRPCIGDHEACRHRRDAGAADTLCSVNPACGHERDWALVRIADDDRKRVLIVGGGPAGMEAARVASLRGFEVLLWERGNWLGGNVRAAAAPDFKQDVAEFLEYQVTQTGRMPIKVELNREATPAEILKTGIQDIIIAVGAKPRTLTISGTGPEVISAATLFLEGTPRRGSVVVVGGGLVGCETAVYLARQGVQVTVVEQLPEILNNAPDANGAMLKVMMHECGVRVLEGAEPVRLVKEGLVVNQSGRETVLNALTIVNATGMEPCNDLPKHLAGKVERVLAIGDCVKPGQIVDAIAQGFQTARTLEA
jgi:2-enoate reductase